MPTTALFTIKPPEWQEVNPGHWIAECFDGTSYEVDAQHWCVETKDLEKVIIPALESITLDGEKER